MKRPFPHLLLLLLSIAAASANARGAAPQPAIRQQAWNLEPYRVQALLALDLPSGLAEHMAAGLPVYVSERAEASIGAVWSLRVSVAAGAERHQVLTLCRATESEEEIALPIPSDDSAPAGNGATADDSATAEGRAAAEASTGERSVLPLPNDCDKLLLLAIEHGPAGYELTAREYDNYVQRWSRPLRRQCRQASALNEQLFALMWQSVSPLAQLELDPEDEHRVVLHPRGAGLPRRSADFAQAAAGDVFLPVLRRTTREGELVADGIQPVPWTFVEVTDAEGETFVGRVHSGTRRPFGVRRRGRIEQVAIALRHDPSPTIVRLHARTDTARNLVGYEVFAQDAGEEDTTAIGRSDRDGQLSIGAGHSGVRLLYVKNGNHLLARLPVVPGAFARVDVPLPEDDVRLQAEARLAALREDLIDVVARRNILIARARQQIENSEFARAGELLAELDRLPGRAQFNQAIARETRLHRSDDPQVQSQINQQFLITQTVLGQYLDPRPIGELRDQLLEAQREGQQNRASTGS